MNLEDAMKKYGILIPEHIENYDKKYIKNLIICI